MNEMVEVLGIAVPQIRVFKDGDEITILFLEAGKTWEQADSLLTFTTAVEPLFYEITSAVNRAVGSLDWNKPFSEVFTKREYRDAVMNIPNFLMGE